MVDLLTLKHRTNKVKIANVQTRELPSGIPINALQGWERVPLHLKLPMLRAPTNQIIFSRNKIGKEILRTHQDYSPHCIKTKFEYNSLHDPHLRNFYANQKILKRLLTNGEITPSNDVICTLKEFNDFRDLLHQSYLTIIRKEMQRMAEDQKDRLRLTHAEFVNEQELLLKERVKGIRTNSEIYQAKIDRDRKKMENYRRGLLRFEQKIKDVEEYQAVRRSLFAQKAVLHEYDIRDHVSRGNDEQRKKLIMFKKYINAKLVRFHNNMKRLKEERGKRDMEQLKKSWERRVKENELKEMKMENLLNGVQKEMEHRIQNHKKRYKCIWMGIQKQIEHRSRSNKNKRGKLKDPCRQRLCRKLRKSLEKSEVISPLPSKCSCLKQMSKKDIRDAVNTAIDMQEQNSHPMYLGEDDHIFKAAKYIIKEILAKFDKDLSADEAACAVVYGRIFKFFKEAKEIVMQKAAHVITDYHHSKRTSVQSFLDCGDCDRRSKSTFGYGAANSMSKFVSFSSIPAIIGRSSYMIAHDIEIKSSRLRPPTPTNSLTSVEGVIVSDENDEQKPRLSLTHLSKDEQIFVEHFLVKFKRELLVGVGKRVFEAIECYKKKKIMHVRKELLDLDKNYLVAIMTRSVLSYAINSYNFQANLRLCVSALAGDIIWSLQKTFLKPERDPRFIQMPKSRCNCSMGQMTLFCG